MDPKLDTGLPLRRVVLHWFGCGLTPKAPGTVGSLGALPFAWVLYEIGGPFLILAAAFALFLIGWWCAEAELGGADADPGWIVVDEVVGQWLVLVLAPHNLVWYAAAFALFRVFDIWKPWPIRWVDHDVGGGFGIMLDDVVAALYAGVIILVARVWLGL
ncbi:MAG: phosphatidylglycerophosphatase A [Rhodospirillaceae bacterium]|nr:phosphatidylglycerophosphatase A [Rhodospirillaceae bacterium]